MKALFTTSLILFALAFSALAELRDLLKNKTLTENVFKSMISTLVKKEQTARQLPQGELSFNCTIDSKDLCIKSWSLRSTMDFRPATLYYFFETEIIVKGDNRSYTLVLDVGYNNETKAHWLDRDNSSNSRVYKWNFLNISKVGAIPTRDVEHQIPKEVEFLTSKTLPFDVNSVIFNGKLTEEMYVKALQKRFGELGGAYHLSGTQKYIEKGHNVRSIEFYSDRIRYYFDISITDAQQTFRHEGVASYTHFLPETVKTA